MKQCPKCSKQIADDAVNCPHCSTSIPDSGTASTGSGSTVSVNKGNVGYDESVTNIINFNIQQNSPEEIRAITCQFATLLEKTLGIHSVMDEGQHFRLTDKDRRKLEAVEDKIRNIDSEYGKAVGDPAFYLRLGNLELSRKNYRKAESFYSQALELDPKLAEAHFNMRFIHLDNDDWESAMDAYNKAVELDSRLRIIPKRYKLKKIIGAGGMSTVYQALDTKEDSEYAIKVLKPDLCHNNQAVKIFKREVGTAKRLGHSNILKVYHLDDYKDNDYIVMEYLPYMNLAQYMESKGGPLSLDDTVEILTQLLDALSAAHKKGIIHRDIKPSNILLGVKDGKPHVKLIDFGLARLITPKMASTRTQSSGTWEYMSDEQKKDSPDIDHRADIYSVGATLYKLLTDDLPEGTWDEPSALRDDCGPEIDEIVRKCLRKKRNKRFQSAADLKNALIKIADTMARLQEEYSELKTKIETLEIPSPDDEDLDEVGLAKLADRLDSLLKEVNVLKSRDYRPAAVTRDLEGNENTLKEASSQIQKILRNVREARERREAAQKLNQQATADLQKRVDTLSRSSMNDEGAVTALIDQLTKLRPEVEAMQSREHLLENTSSQLSMLGNTIDLLVSKANEALEDLRRKKAEAANQAEAEVLLGKLQQLRHPSQADEPQLNENRETLQNLNKQIEELRKKENIPSGLNRELLEASRSIEKGIVSIEASIKAIREEEEKRKKAEAAIRKLLGALESRVNKFTIPPDPAKETLQKILEDVALLSTKTGEIEHSKYFQKDLQEKLDFVKSGIDYYQKDVRNRLEAILESERIIEKAKNNNQQDTIDLEKLVDAVRNASMSDEDSIASLIEELTSIQKNVEEVRGREHLFKRTSSQLTGLAEKIDTLFSDFKNALEEARRRKAEEAQCQRAALLFEKLTKLTIPSSADEPQLKELEDSLKELNEEISALRHDEHIPSDLGKKLDTASDDIHNELVLIEERIQTIHEEEEEKRQREELARKAIEDERHKAEEDERQRLEEEARKEREAQRLREEEARKAEKKADEEIKHEEERRQREAEQEAADNRPTQEEFQRREQAGQAKRKRGGAYRWMAALLVVLVAAGVLYYVYQQKKHKELQAEQARFQGDLASQEEHIRRTEEAKKLAAQKAAEEQQKKKEEAARKVEEEWKHRVVDARVPEPGQEKTVDLGGGVKLELVWIPPGEFTMGSPDSESGRDSDEGPQHQVKITKGFWMGKYEVTYDQYMEYVRNGGGREPKKDDDDSWTNLPGHPVVDVSWDDSVGFCQWLSRQTGQSFRLPTEAEWEYACRAGSHTALYNGPLTIKGARNGPELGSIAWYGGNSGVGYPYSTGYDSSGWSEKQYNHSRAGTRMVGQKEPNAWGLYDMIGNVWEWCQDWKGSYSSGTRKDPQEPSSGSDRVLRGGSWGSFAKGCRSAYRGLSTLGFRDGDIGFRVVLSASHPAGEDALSVSLEQKRREAAARVPEPGQENTVDLGGGVKLELVWIPSGEFIMGSPDSEAGRDSDEGPQHKVKITSGFWMGKYEVTYDQYMRYVRTGGGREPQKDSDDSWTNLPGHPVVDISWDDSVGFCQWLSRKTGKSFRLPTEAEWEYACRAGTSTALYNGPLTIKGARNGPELDSIAWYGGNSGVGYPYSTGYDSSGWSEKQYDHTRTGTRKVGQKKPNSWGLYDMIGNVWEWCQDWKGSYSSGTQVDPQGPSSGSGRVLRGGSWSNYAGNCRSANRRNDSPDSRYHDIGFRIVLSASQD